MSNPYATPESFDSGQDPIPNTHDNYGGIGRLTYVGILVGFVLAISNLFNHSERIIHPWFVLIAGIPPAYFRLKNIGMNPKLSFLLLIPVANYLVIFRCLVAQQGYVRMRKLDRIGKMIAALTILAAAAFALLLMYSY